MYWSDPQFQNFQFELHMDYGAIDAAKKTIVYLIEELILTVRKGFKRSILSNNTRAHTNNSYVAYALSKMLVYQPQSFQFKSEQNR